MWEPSVLPLVLPNSTRCLKLYVTIIPFLFPSFFPFASSLHPIYILFFFSSQFAITNKNRAVVGTLLGDGVEITVDKDISEVCLMHPPPHSPPSLLIFLIFYFFISFLFIFSPRLYYVWTSENYLQTTSTPFMTSRTLTISILYTEHKRRG